MWLELAAAAAVTADDCDLLRLRPQNLAYIRQVNTQYRPLM